MNNKEYVIYKLQTNNNTFISGEDLAKELNISRAAISKIIKEIKNSGIIIESVQNKGYKLSDTNDLLSLDILQDNLKGRGLDYNVHLHSTIDSTNLEAKRLISSNDFLGKTLIVSGEQIKGKGRFGKNFFSPKNSGVYFSVIENAITSLSNSTFITICTALSICKAIEKLTGYTPKIKWVNDIFLDDRKTCGILTEAISNFETGEVEKLIIGIGINFSTIDFPQEIEDIAGPIFKKPEDNHSHITRNDLVIEIVYELNKYFKNFDSINIEELIAQYKSRSNIIGKEITVTLSNQKPFNAKALDINNLGHLIVKKENLELLTLNYGDVSIRKI